MRISWESTVAGVFLCAMALAGWLDHPSTATARDEAALYVSPSQWTGRTSAAPAHGHEGLTCAACHAPRSDDQTRSFAALSMGATSASAMSLGSYQSPSMLARVGPPDGSSLLCLSCHDGSNSQVSSRFTFGPGGGLGSLANSHPVSFVYDSALAAQDGHLVNPLSLPPGVLDENGKMQCTSCHDPHPSTAVGSTYLRWRYDASVPTTTAAFCRQCHDR